MSAFLSIRTRIVLIILVLGLGGEVVKASFDILRVGEIVADEAERAMRTTLYRVEGVLEKALSDGRLDDAQWMISVLAVRDEDVWGAIIDPDGKVIAATRREMRGKSWADVRPTFGFKDGQSLSDEVTVAHAESVVTATAPICVLASTGLRTRVCHTYIQRETTGGRRAALIGAHMKEAGGRILVIVLLSLLLWMALGASIVRRSLAIVSAVREFEAGRMAARSRVTGADELGQIGDALDGAFSRISGMVRETIDAFSATTLHTDPYTAGHEERVADLSVALGREMGLDEGRLEGLEIAAKVHDIGQTKIPSEIILRPRRLTPVEFAFIRQHPEVGAEILGSIDFPWPVAEIVRQHHENFDGSGYPNGLEGAEILLEARILHVADCLEALSSHRPYRDAFAWEDAMAQVERMAGSWFDPDVVAACKRLVADKGYAFPSLQMGGRAGRPPARGKSASADATIASPSPSVAPIIPVSQDMDGEGARIRRAMELTIEAISATLESRDPYTAGHERRVADFSVAIATKLGLDPFRIEGLRLAATVHDIGKIQIPIRILANPGRLSEAEFELIKTHPAVGHEILKNLDLPWPIAEMVHQHHELLDGSGYPRSLKGDQISLEARILTVADIVESMSAARPYRPALGIGAALAEIQRQRGTKLDPLVVDACVEVFSSAETPVD